MNPVEFVALDCGGARGLPIGQAFRRGGRCRRSLVGRSIVNSGRIATFELDDYNLVRVLIEQGFDEDKYAVCSARTSSGSSGGAPRAPGRCAGGLMCR